MPPEKREELPSSGSSLTYPPDKYWDAHYDELRKISRALLRGQNWTKQPTELVNEAYLRERSSAPFLFRDRAHFRAAMARRLRQVYLDEWKRRTAAKRDARTTVPLADHEPALQVDEQELDDFQVVTLTFAHLERHWPGLGLLFEQKIFGELDNDELARLHGVAAGTIRVRLHRARQRAAAFLDNRAIEGALV